MTGGAGSRGGVTGIGGVFLRAKDPARLGAWYREHLGLDVGPAGWAVLTWEYDSVRPGSTVWAAFPPDTSYFGRVEQQSMINYRVRDLDAVVARLRGAGVPVDEKRHPDENGRFAWATDPEGNRFELWEPAPGH